MARGREEAGEAAARWTEAQGQGGRNELGGGDRRRGAQSPRQTVPEEGLLGGGPQAGLGDWAIGRDVHQEVACTRGSLGCRWGRGCPQPQEVGGG